MTLLRTGLGVLAAAQAFVGGWALAAPRSFFDNGPFPGTHWVAMFPPYNEHLMRDFGALSLSLCAVLVFAAVTAQRTVVRAALVAYVAFAVPHLAFHLNHLDHMPVADRIGNVVALVVAVLLPLALWPLTRSAADDGIAVV
ncbi:hypothetical protein Lesp02_63690 [Lentzea sp. NBRC 105346]|uniref:hypothetical protein n=1 Tax=Lentzea sp. NBRC 105346 TaxID=3032205 RepID=UPI0024A4EB80|nr:hypothetical protein [Lentzea sp. NBRC 105346]GLZ34182.1 hypothetical protein Lesp02_63690 [Lentzea sp. NBRC 105346]